MTTKKQAITVPIIDIQLVATDTWRATLLGPEIAQNALAGQFVNISVRSQTNTLWRRPLGIHQTNPEKGTFDILFKALGRGTRAIAAMKKDEKLDIIGPLGNTFQYLPNLKEVIMVAGGLGIAVFPLLLQNLKEKNVYSKLFFGVKTANEFCCLDTFKEHGTELYLTTDDGTMGEKGFITQSLEKYLASLDTVNNKQLCVCGPTPMMRAVQELALKYNIDTQASLETIMACGFGACMGCPVPLKNPPAKGATYKLACKDGPVFNVKDIIIND